MSVYTQDTTSNQTAEQSTTGTDTTTTDSTDSTITELKGFAEVEWMNEYSNVKETFKSLISNPDSKEKIEIVNEKKEKNLLIRRNGIFYQYRFYQVPKKLQTLRTPPTENTDNTQNQDTTTTNTTEVPDEDENTLAGILYSVGVQFSLVPGMEIQSKLMSKYGNPTREKLDDKKRRGAVIWEKLGKDENGNTTGGYVIQWREEYNSSSFTRRVDYISYKMIDVLKKDYKDYYSMQEIQILQDLIP